MPKTLVAEPARGQVQSTVSEAALKQILKPGLLAGLEEIGRMEVDDIVADLDIPIEYGPHPPIRSGPGEPPRRGVKSQPLQDSITHDVDSDAIRLTISANRPATAPGYDPNVAVLLEFGGVNYLGKPVSPRPFMTPAKHRVEQYAEKVIADNLRRHLGSKK
jgi:hypothetical protein